MNELTEQESEIVQGYFPVYDLDRVRTQIIFFKDNTLHLTGNFTLKQLEGLCIISSLLRGFRQSKE